MPITEVIAGNGHFGADARFTALEQGQVAQDAAFAAFLSGYAQYQLDLADAQARGLQLAVIQQTAPNRETTVGPGTWAEADVFGPSLTPPLKFSYNWPGSAEDWEGTISGLRVPDTGYYSWAMPLSLASTGAGVIWHFRWRVNGVDDTAEPPRRVPTLAEPVGMELVNSGNFASLSPAERNIRLFVSHNSMVNETLTILFASLFARRITDVLGP